MSRFDFPNKGHRYLTGKRGKESNSQLPFVLVLTTLEKWFRVVFSIRHNSFLLFKKKSTTKLGIKIFDVSTTHLNLRKVSPRKVLVDYFFYCKRVRSFDGKKIIPSFSSSCRLVLQLLIKKWTKNEIANKVGWVSRRFTAWRGLKGPLNKAVEYHLFDKTDNRQFFPRWQ